MKNVLFVASESVPFIKTGGLADVIGSLPQELKNSEGLEVRVALPFYDEIDVEWKEQMEYFLTVDVNVGWRKHQAEIYTLTHQDIVYYFFANDYYFTRKGIYGYYDDGERFLFYCNAVIAALPMLDFKPDVLHAHDWQAGFAVARANITQVIPEMKTVFTIHNIKYQGVLPTDIYDDFFADLGREHFAGMEWHGMLNAMKAALFHADKITTVSPSYAKEIMEPYYGEGLDSMLHMRKEDVVGIINGIDQKEYNPMTDKHLSIRYRSARDKKMQNRELLYEDYEFLFNADAPLYIIISRLVEQKGLDLVTRVMEEFLQENIQLMVLGTGEFAYEQYFLYLNDKYPEKVKTLLTFDEGLSRKLYASADFLLMPSKFEPCGLSQLIAYQYKTVPIVRETGGLRDTVIPFNEETGTGNGFSFAAYNAHDFLKVMRYSLEIYNDQQKWQQLIKNVNKSSYSWKKSAEEYKQLYQEIASLPS